ncbi:hypothetical protein CI109_103046 [Kwoniella shandongensis]|uniref:Uncharacterized protein n=1 Tax=Kwoniella shandongensis TaxID=1734106 RepID=A0A5M6C8C1_9TREE|nr:uncharacterized protein CI109_000237 [Kwoniella shandongensis]KAA5531396.1 hypothetical protein CI109_000237 [Kwoniella shandongensis]
MSSAPKEPPATPRRLATNTHLQVENTGPSPRIPYRATSTPPRTPLALHTPPPVWMSSRPVTPREEYPESPTSFRPRASSNQMKPPPFSLGQPPAPRSRRLPKLFRSPKRALIYLVLLGLLGLTVKVLGRFGKHGLVEGGLGVGRLIWKRHQKIPVEEIDDGLCRFVSPVDAYQRDLRRLRKLHPSSSHHDPLSHPHPPHNLTSHNSHSHTKSHHHTYSPTGHLLVSSDPEAPHPIPLLLDLGEKRWEELLSRQSRTLSEAVREYTRRYGRRPPKGFDVWWDFAMQHNLVLPDEYDRINLDLAPFFALPKDEMKRRMTMVEDMAETFTLIIENGQVDIQIKDPGGLEWGGTLPRAADTANLLRAFSRFLPDMRATFSIFDQPQIYLSWARRGSLVDLGLRGEHTTHLEETDSAHVKLSRSCAPDSNYRKEDDFSEGKSFIYDSLEAGDLCQNPYLIPIHGLTIEPHGHDSHPRPHTQLLPLFSLAKTSINSDILITPLDQFNDNPGNDPAWENKTSSKLAWRGSPTGISMMSADLPWRQAHRIRLHTFAQNRSSDAMTFIVPDLGQDDEDDQEEESNAEPGTGSPESHHQSHSQEAHSEGGEALHFIEEEVTTREAMTFFYDMKLAGDPIQCLDEDGTCADMRTEIQWAPHQRGEELNKHKFLLDIDGNGWSGRFRKLMSTNSVVIKMTMFTEWFQPHLIPWFMYIPAKLDFSDLTDIMAFFRGTPNHPELAFDETAAALARNGQCFVQRMFRVEDLQAYMMRLFLEYARIAADEGIDMDFYLDDEVVEGEGEGTTIEVVDEQDLGPHPQGEAGIAPAVADVDWSMEGINEKEVVEVDAQPIHLEIQAIDEILDIQQVDSWQSEDLVDEAADEA